VRSIYADWERGDFTSAHWADRDIEFVMADGPTAGRWTGVPGMTHAMRDFLGAWEGSRIEVEECRQVDGERVLVLTCVGGRGKTSGLDIGHTRAVAAAVFRVRQGK
jgi:hypothetical protein